MSCGGSSPVRSSFAVHHQKTVLCRIYIRSAKEGGGRTKAIPRSITALSTLYPEDITDVARNGDHCDIRRAVAGGSRQDTALCAHAGRGGPKVRLRFARATSRTHPLDPLGLVSQRTCASRRSHRRWLLRDSSEILSCREDSPKCQCHNSLSMHMTNGTDDDFAQRWKMHFHVFPFRGYSVEYEGKQHCAYNGTKV
jgi:hypothetical protein